MLAIPLYAWAFLLFLLSSCFYPGFWPFDVNILLAICTAGLVAVAVSFKVQKISLPKWPLLFIAVLLILQIFIFFRGDIQAPGSWKLQAAMHLAAVAFFIAGIAIPSSTFRTWMHAYIAGVVIWLMIGWLVWLGATNSNPLGFSAFTITMAPSVKLAGPFNQGNIFAAGLGMAWLFAHWLHLKSRRPVSGFLIIIFSAGLIDTLSRGGVISYSICLALLLWAWRPSFQYLAIKIIPLWVAGLILGLFMLHFSIEQPPQDAFLSLAATASASIEARLIIWLTAFHEFSTSPWLGVGWGQFQPQFWISKPDAIAQAQTLLGSSPALSSSVLSAHNLTLQLLAEGGILVLAALLSAMIFLIVRTYRLIASCSNRTPFALSSLGFIIQSQINVCYSSPVLFLSAALFAGISMAPWLRRKANSFMISNLSRSLLVVFCLLGFSFSYQQSKAWFDAEPIIQHLDLNNKQSLESFVNITGAERARIIPLVWLGYKIAIEQKHANLLHWIEPYLLVSAQEIPMVDVYQVLFYTLAHNGKYAQACKLGKLIEKQKFPVETNSAAYQEICAGKRISAYHFGH